MEFFKLLLPFLSTPKNYGDVLRKLASFAFYETYIITLVLRSNQRIDSFLNEIETWGAVGKATSIIPHHNVLNLSGLVLAALVAILTHTFQLHDRISDIFGIRRRFDVRSILIPLSQQVGSALNETDAEKLTAHRDEAMHSVFYKYASSRSEQPLVDKHDIEHALNAWSWFWVFVEGVFYFGLGALAAWISTSPSVALAFTATSAFFLFIASMQHARLSRYARPQVASIAANPEAAAAVKGYFDAI